MVDPQIRKFNILEVKKVTYKIDLNDFVPIVLN